MFFYAMHIHLVNMYIANDTYINIYICIYIYICLSRATPPSHRPGHGLVCTLYLGGFVSDIVDM